MGRLLPSSTLPAMLGEPGTVTMPHVQRRVRCPVGRDLRAALSRTGPVGHTPERQQGTASKGRRVGCVVEDLHKGADGVGPQRNVRTVVTEQQHADDHTARLEYVTRAVRDWKAQLFDATGNNRLLFYRELRKGTLKLTDVDADEAAAMLQGRKVRLSRVFPDSPSNPRGHSDALARARTIHKAAITNFEERGIETLFLARGMATWTTEDTKATPSAPVLLRPVQLTPTSAAEADFDLELHGDWEVSATLLHYLATKHGAHIDGTALLEAHLDEDGVDADELFADLVAQMSEVPDFAVDQALIVGNFQYQKLPMVRDIEESIDQIAEHDLLAAVAQAPEAKVAVTELGQREVDASLPDYIPPADEYLIVDADSSQNHALNAAIAGQPLVIQGPPGTGKSQTISNLIAALTARGKKVLFVAEKRAAIDAVTKRLRTAGLGNLVLDLHGGVTSKRQLAEDIARSLDDIGRIPEVRNDDRDHALVAARDALTAHAKAMHAERKPWGVSVWDVQKQLLGMDEPAFEVQFVGEHLQSLTAEVVRTVREHLGEWAHLSAPFVDGSSPWAGATIRTAEDAERVLTLAGQLANDLVPAARTRLDAVLADTGVRPPGDVPGWEPLLAHLDAVAEAGRTFEAEVWQADLDALVTALQPAAGGWWKRASAPMFDGDYRRAKRTLRELHRGEDKVAPATLHEQASHVRDLAGQWQRLAGSGAPHAPETLADATAAYVKMTQTVAELERIAGGDVLSRRRVDDLDGVLRRLIADQSNLVRLPRVLELEASLEALRLTKLLQLVRDRQLPAGELVDTFTYSWLASIRNHAAIRDPALSAFDGALQTRRQADYITYDEEHLEHTAPRVLRRVAEAAVAACSAHPDQHDLVKAQARKKRGHLTLRRLFEQAPDVLTALRPCWVMSPLVVAQTLPARQIFDVVIFDEASQVLPADAVSALLRAPQAIVAGDRRQLPPTTFFAGGDDTYDDEDGEDAADGLELTRGFESILDQLSTFLRDYYLTWHYRSRDERLIAFSNHKIYDSGLTTFPGARIDGCLSYVAVPHRSGAPIDTASNPDEVARVVDLMVDHARRRPDESLGVIAMGQHHAGRIDAALRQRLGEEADPHLEAFFDETSEERPFIKNIERVQGDERDAIILTTGYAKNADGKLRYNFGALNNEGGERRLNVAVTRAKQRLIVVSSFNYVDMGSYTGSAQGVLLLRDYLHFAYSGGEDLQGAERNTPLNPFERDVKHRLEQRDLTVCPQYGSSKYRIDFAIPHPADPGCMVLAVEADGASYHNTPTARDRDRLRQQVLESRGWIFHRIWSTDWFNDPESEADKVLAAFEAAVAAVDAGEATGMRAAAPDEDDIDVEYEWEYEQPERNGSRPPLPYGPPITQYEHRQLVALAKWIQSDTLLRTEDQLLSEMMDELGFQKRGKRIVDSLLAAIRAS
jgi:very-short-patch-repair endonuclease